MKPFHKLFAPENLSNSGTSEGVKKAWETRRGNGPRDMAAAQANKDQSTRPYNQSRESYYGMSPEAYLAGSEAHAASAKAFSSGDPGDHYKAAKEHAYAAKLYEEQFFPGIDAQHSRMADVHRQYANGETGKASTK